MSADDEAVKLPLPSPESPSPNQDSDYDSMFGDDSDSDKGHDHDDQDSMFGGDSDNDIDLDANVDVGVVQVDSVSSSPKSENNKNHIHINQDEDSGLGNSNVSVNKTEGPCAYDTAERNHSSDNCTSSIPKKNTSTTTKNSNSNMKIPRKKSGSRKHINTSPPFKKKYKLSETAASINPNSSSLHYLEDSSLKADSLSYDSTSTPSFDIESYNSLSSFVDPPNSTEKSSTSTGVARKSSRQQQQQQHHQHQQKQQQTKQLRPDQYPQFDMDQCWRTFRAWNFIYDLNQSAKKNHPSNSSASSTRTSVSSEEHDNEVSTPPLPEEFHCHEQYVALWAPLLIREVKAQIISDVSSLSSSTSAPLSKYAQPVNVSVKNPNSSRRIGEDNYCDYLTLNITVSSHRGHNTTGNNCFSGGRGGGGQGRTTKITQNFLRNEFAPNEMVFLITEPTFLDQASKGKLTIDKGSNNGSTTTSTYSMMTLLSNASPFVNGRMGAVGIVTQRSKNLKSGLTVQISKRLLKDTTGDQFSVCLLRIGHNVTGIRELRALCNVSEMPMMKYILSAKRQHNHMSSLSTYQKATLNNPLSEHGGRNALGIGFRIWVKSKFNNSQQEAINAASREYGSGGFSLVKGPPGTGKTTTLSALVNALHLKQYQRYYSEIEKITLSTSSNNHTETLSAITAAAKVKPRILICAPSNAAVDNIIIKIVEDRFMDGNGGKYNPSLVRVGAGYSSSVSNITLDHWVNQIIGEGSKPKSLEQSIQMLKKDLRRLQDEIKNLQRRVRLIANACSFKLSRDWEIRIDEQNFKEKERVLFVNHKLKKVELKCPPKPQEGEDLYPFSEMPHYRSCMNSLVKYIERHNESYSKLMQLVLVQNTAVILDSSNYNQTSMDLRQQLETHVLNSTHIVMTTLGSAGSKTMENVIKFSVIVIDEAAQSSEPSTLPALQLGSSHCVLVGDPQQLPATIFSMSGRMTKYDRSLFQRLEEGGHHVNMLNTQYRMHPKISSFPRQIFYDGTLLDGPNVNESTYGGELGQVVRSKFRYFQPLTVLDLDSSEEREGTNLSNIDEAQLALHLFCSLDNETGGLSKKSKTAIITPYMQQVILLKRLFENKYGLSYNRLVDISTIDAFQGKEANIVILSCVRGASRGVGIGFLSDVQRMNVALTRAKHFLFVIARCRTILVNPFWRDLVGYARKQQSILRVMPKKIVHQSGAKRNLRKRNGDLIEKSFPNLRNIRPIHLLNEEECGAKSYHKHFQDESDGNISA